MHIQIYSRSCVSALGDSVCLPILTFTFEDKANTQASAWPGNLLVLNRAARTPTLQLTNDALKRRDNSNQLFWVALSLVSCLAIFQLEEGAVCQLVKQHFVGAIISTIIAVDVGAMCVDVCGRFVRWQHCG